MMMYFEGEGGVPTASATHARTILFHDHCLQRYTGVNEGACSDLSLAQLW